jgi:hypothetical protein
MLEREILQSMLMTIHLAREGPSAQVLNQTWVGAYRKCKFRICDDYLWLEQLSSKGRLVR